MTGGSVGITGPVTVDGNVNITGGNVGITGTVTTNTNITGGTVNANVTGGAVGITGTVTTNTNITGGTVNATVTGNLRPSYGTAGQSVTITLASLANASVRSSTVVSNTSNLYEDVLIFIKFRTNITASISTGYVNVYGYGSVDGGTTYPESITGTDGSVTLSSPTTLVLLSSLPANSSSKTYTAGPFSLCRSLNLDRLPAQWGIVFENRSGYTLDATTGNFAITYQGVNGRLI